jgi:hypothetical protein
MTAAQPITRRDPRLAAYSVNTRNLIVQRVRARVVTGTPTDEALADVLATMKRQGALAPAGPARVAARTKAAPAVTIEPTPYVSPTRGRDATGAVARIARALDRVGRGALSPVIESPAPTHGFIPGVFYVQSDLGNWYPAHGPRPVGARRLRNRDRRNGMV